MIRSRFGLLGLCAVVFSVMAFNATTAQATSGAHWWILNSAGTVKTDAASLTAGVNFKKEIKFIMHFKVFIVSVLIECETIEAIKANLLANGSIGESAGNVKGSQIKLTGCITKLNGATSAPCEPKNGTEKGVIVTKPSHGLIVLHEGGVELIQILPDEGETFATITSGSECAIGEKVPIIGKAFLKDCLNLFRTHVVEHLIEIGPLTELFAISKTEEHRATILVSFWAFLTGTHLGLKWGGEAA